MKQDFAKRIKTLRAALQFFDPLRVVDIGANPLGYDTPYNALHKNNDLVVTGFDAQADTLKGLIRDGNDGDQYLPFAVGDGKTHELHIYRGTGLTSLLPLRQKTLLLLRHRRRAAQLESMTELPTVKLDEIDEITQCDLLKIDVQGAEIMVFDNGLRKLETAVAVHTEVSFFPLYENQPSFGEVDVALRKAGFLPHSFYSIVKRKVVSKYLENADGAPATQLLDGDLLYFRDLSAAEDLSDKQLCKMALIADGVYGFFDYTLKCLEILSDRGVSDDDAIKRYCNILKAG